jgi:hypothetical protein
MRQDHLFDRAPLADLWEAGAPEPPALLMPGRPEVPAPPAAYCLNCGKPARVLTPGRAAVFCGQTCKRAWTGSMNQWYKRYTRDCDRADKGNQKEITLW